MKNVKWIFLLVISAVIFACGGNSSKAKEDKTATEETSPKNDLEGMEMIDLSDYDLDATIYIPGAKKGKPMIELTDWGSVQISVGKRYGLEIVPFGATLAEKKEELNSDLVYTVDYLEEDANYIVYQKSIADSEVEPEFHFFMNIELNGDVYEIKNINNQSYKKKAIEKMMQSAKTLSAKKEA